MSVREIFLQAMALEPSDRSSWLATACGADAGLRRRVERLLDRAAARDTLLDQPLSELLQAAGVSRGRSGGLTIVSGEPTARLLALLSPSPHPESLGRLGHYDVREVLGEGGFGVVVRAFDEKLHRIVAIKTLAPQLAENVSARRRFIQEARAAAGVIHENVIAIHAVEDEAAVPYLVMQCLDGKTLQRLIDDGPLSAESIARIGSQIAEGLAAAHRCGLVHRDIKPANILLENGVERVKITDFGLAGAAGSLGDDTSVPALGLTSQDSLFRGFLAGTPQYMSPEQAAGKPLDPRSDLFSLGCVLYAMATGRPPFARETTLATLAAVRGESPPRLAETAAHLPVALRDLIERLLQKNPDERFAGANDVSAALRGSLETSDRPGLAATPAAHGSIPAEPQASRAVEAVAADFRSAGRGNDDRTAPPARSERLLRLQLPWVAAAVVAAAALFGTTEATGVTRVASTVLRLLRPEGTLVVETRDPEVSVTVDGEDVVITGAGPKEVRLKAGQYRLTATKDGRVVRQELVTISRDGREVVAVGMEPPNAASKDDVPAIPDSDAERTWLVRTLKLPLNERFQAVVARLKDQNPGWNDKLVHHEVVNNEIVLLRLQDTGVVRLSPVRALTTLRSLSLVGSPVSDLTPISSLPLVHLDANTTQVSDLRPLVGMPLESLVIRATPVRDLSPLAKLPLQRLSMEYTLVSDLSPLRGMKLESLWCADTQVTDLSPLKGMPLRELVIAGLRLSDIRPLEGMSLTTLFLDRSDVSDLKPIRGMPLKKLTLEGLKGIDLRDLEGMPLEDLSLDFDPERDGPFLRSITTLKTINGEPVAAVLP